MDDGPSLPDGREDDLDEEGLSDEDELGDELEDATPYSDDDLAGELAEEPDDPLTPEDDYLQPRFVALRDLAIDVAGLVPEAWTERALADGIAAAAAQGAARYPSLSEVQRGVLLASLLASLVPLFALGREIERDPRRYYKDEEEPLASYNSLMPSIRSCTKFVSDQIAEFARGLVQSEAGVSRAIADDLAVTPDHQVAQDRALALALEHQGRRSTVVAPNVLRASRAPGAPPRGQPAVDDVSDLAVLFRGLADDQQVTWNSLRPRNVTYGEVGADEAGSGEGVADEAGSGDESGEGVADEAGSGDEGDGDEGGEKGTQ